jgi:NADH:ubiquinone oxidoreductase subunit H
LRYDKVMKLEWKFLLPVAILNILATGILMAIVG